jgi:gluconolactonase
MLTSSSVRLRTSLLVALQGLAASACSSAEGSDDVTNADTTDETTDQATNDSSDAGDTGDSPEPQSELRTVQTGFGFTEGPAVDKDGNVFFTDQPNDRIHKWEASTGAVTVFLEGTGRANGMAFDRDGYLIACADMFGELWKIAPDGSHEVIASDYGGKPLNGPNDVWINRVTGGIYISDPMFPRDYWEDEDPRKQSWPPTHSEQASDGIGGHVYYLAPGATELVRVTTMPEWDADTWPNGLVGTPDGKRLYVNKWASDNKGGTFAFDINTDGSLSNHTQLLEHGGDGMSMDELGNLYISNALGVEVFDPSGGNLLTIPTNFGSKTGATNNVFAGSDGKTLFITGPSDRIVTVEMNVAGVEKW